MGIHLSHRTPTLTHQLGVQGDLAACQCHRHRAAGLDRFSLITEGFCIDPRSERCGVKFKSFYQR